MDLKNWRKKNKLSSVQAAQILGVSDSHVRAIERGDRLPSLKTAQRIEQNTGGEITVADLVQIAGYEIRKVAQ